MVKEDDIEVDPELFNLCRLCVDNKGKFLITPAMVQQTKFCFDITIDIYDGLPHLLCSPCKNKLNEFYAMKNAFIEKQKSLFIRNNVQLQPTETVVSSSQPDTDDPLPSTSNAKKKDPKSKDVTKRNSKSENEVVKKSSSDTTKTQKQERETKSISLSAASEQENETTTTNIKSKIQDDLNVSKSTIATAKPFDTPENINKENVMLTSEQNKTKITDKKSKTKPSLTLNKIISVSKFPEIFLTEPSSKPITETSSKPITEPSLKLITEPTSKPITEPYSKPITEPSLKPNKENSINQNFGSHFPQSFQMYYICKYCNKKIYDANDLKRHARTHKGIIRMMQKEKIVPCTVSLSSINQIPNMTGSLAYVIIDSERILSNVYKKNYNIYYEPKSCYTSFIDQKNNDNQSNMNIDPTLPERKLSSDNELQKRKISECSLDDINNKVEKKRRRLQISSDEDSDTSTVNMVYDNANEDTKETKKNASKRKAFDDEVKNLKSLVHSTFNKYKRFSKDSETDPKCQDMLNNKLLNLGTKSMVKAGVQSIGLLKYLEKRNLEIVWRNTDTNPTSWQVRINTKLFQGYDLPNTLEGFQEFQVKGKYELKDKIAEVTPYNIGDVKIQLTPATLLNEAPVPNPKQSLSKSRTFNPTLNKQDDVLNNLFHSDVALTENVASCMPLQNNDEDIICLDSDDDSNNVLLPVITSTTSLASCESENIDSKTNILPSLDSVNNSNSKISDSNECILKAYEPQTKKQNNSKIGSANTDGQPIRIKCKPASELMAPPKDGKETLPSSNNPLLADEINRAIIQSPVSSKDQEIRVPNQPKSLKTATEYTPLAVPSFATTHNFIPCDIQPSALSLNGNSANPKQQHVVVPTSQPLNSTLNLEKSLKALVAAPKNDFIILTSVALASTLTASPIRYISKLLEMYKIKLQLTSEPLPPSFHSLIRFKIKVNQLPTTNTLSVQLFVAPNEVCIRVSNSENKVVDTEKMVGPWQWEILKSFKQISVVKKIINASQSLGEPIIQTAKTFSNLMGTVEKVDKKIS